jgi:N-acetylglutamate synthase-like GNAT family acetyltransferase
MYIRKARMSDLKTVIAISRKNRFEVMRDWKDAISSENSEMFLLVDGKMIRGFTGLIYHDWNRTIQVMDVFLEPDLRGRGMGIKLIKFLVSRARRQSNRYRCLIAEAPAIGGIDKFYRKAGFRKCGYNDRYYANGGKNIAIWMSLDLVPAKR